MDLLILVMLVIHLIMNSIILFRLNKDNWEWFFFWKESQPFISGDFYCSFYVDLIKIIG